MFSVKEQIYITGTKDWLVNIVINVRNLEAY